MSWVAIAAAARPIDTLLERVTLCCVDPQTEVCNVLVRAGVCRASQVRSHRCAFFAEWKGLAGVYVASACVSCHL